MLTNLITKLAFFLKYWLDLAEVVIVNCKKTESIKDYVYR